MSSMRRRQSAARLIAYFRVKLSAELGPHDVKRRLDQEPRTVTLLDVRSVEGYRQGHLPGAIHIPYEELSARLKELSPRQSIITYCWSATCLLSARASYLLALRGYRVQEMLGGIADWQTAGFSVER